MQNDPVGGPSMPKLRHLRRSNDVGFSPWSTLRSLANALFPKLQPSVIVAETLRILQQKPQLLLSSFLVRVVVNLAVEELVKLYRKLGLRCAQCVGCMDFL
ncbi:hypothetical protein AKJ16_DCAP16621 [Drosera capensis]